MTLGSNINFRLSSINIGNIAATKLGEGISKLFLLKNLILVLKYNQIY